MQYQRSTIYAYSVFTTDISAVNVFLLLVLQLATDSMCAPRHCQNGVSQKEKLNIKKRTLRPAQTVRDGKFLREVLSDPWSLVLENSSLCKLIGRRCLSSRTVRVQHVRKISLQMTLTFTLFSASIRKVV